MTDKKKLVQYVTRHSVIFSTFQNLPYIITAKPKISKSKGNKYHECDFFLFVNTNNKKKL